MIDSKKSTPSIMIVDDTTANLQLLGGMLKDSDYKVRPVTSGALALEAARRLPPDLILLDINMPGMNGYEVCEQLKADPALACIPVIFLSALSETEDKIRAFQAGGVDYITKPFQFEEVHARVECQLNLRRLRQDLELQNAELEKTNQRLHESEALRDSLVHMIVHDMRSPLTVQMGFLELLTTSASTPLGEREASWVAAAYETSFKLTNMVSSLLDISRMEAGKMPVHRQLCDVRRIARTAIDFYRPLIGRRECSLAGAEAPVMADCDPALIQRVIENILGNALKFTSQTGSVRIAVTQSGNEVRVAITDNGPGIAPEHHESIFTKFGQAGAQKRTHSTGVGLAFCKMAVEANEGNIGVESEPGKGSTFWFTLKNPQTQLPAIGTVLQ